MEITQEILKQTVKQGIIEALQERSDLLRNTVDEIMEEDEAMILAIRESDNSPEVTREQVFQTLQS